jgi:hypothetical protein
MLCRIPPAPICFYSHSDIVWVSHLIATLVKRLWLSYTTWLAHSGYPLDLDTERNPRTAAAHVPYAVLQLPMVLNIITPAHNEYHQ